MENLSEISGYPAMVLLTFLAKDTRVLRAIAISSNIAFIAYGTSARLPPVLLLHMLRLNIVRLAETVRARRTRRNLRQADAVAQTLGADTTSRGQSPLAPWPIFPGRSSSARRRRRTHPSQSNAASHEHRP
jgi:hypothetical protein